MLTGQLQLAPWVNSSLSATELDRALENHRKLYAWDVIVSCCSWNIFHTYTSFQNEMISEFRQHSQRNIQGQHMDAEIRRRGPAKSFNVCTGHGHAAKVIASIFMKNWQRKWQADLVMLAAQYERLRYRRHQLKI